MKRSTLGFAAAALVAGSTLVPLAHAQSTPNGPNTPEQRAIEAARKGPDALRRFVERTRMVYGLTFEAFRRYL